MLKDAIGFAAIAATLWAATPAAAETTALPGPSGGKVFKTKCRGSSDGCYQEAAQYCRGSYQILGSESHGGGIITDLFPGGPVMYYSMTYACGPSNGRLAGFPFNGPEWQPPRPFYGECNGYNNGVNCYGWR